MGKSVVPRVFVVAMLVLASVPFLVLAAFTIQRGSNVHELGQDEREVVNRAARFVGDHVRSNGRHPAEAEFRAWAEGAGYVRGESVSSQLPPQWAVLSYQPPVAGGREYSLRIWDGDCDRTWQSEPEGNARITVDPTCYFVFGSQPVDLIVFLFSGVLLLTGAGSMAARRR